MAELQDMSVGELYKQLSAIHDQEEHARARGISVNNSQTVKAIFAELAKRKAKT